MKRVAGLLIALGLMQLGAHCCAEDARYAPTIQQAESAACGDFHVAFETAGVPELSMEGSHRLAPAVAGKATVYMISDFGSVGIFPLLRIGADGQWEGASYGPSYLYFYVAPGKHHFCVDWQSALDTAHTAVVLKDMNTQAGEVYYLRIRNLATDIGLYGNDSSELDIESVDASEGLLLLAEYPQSTCRISSLYTSQ